MNSNNISIFYIPRPFRTWSVIALHNFLTFVIVVNCVFSLSHLIPVPLTIYRSSLGRFFAAFLYPFAFRMPCECQIIQFFIFFICPKDFTCLFLTINISFIFVPIFCKTSYTHVQSVRYTAHFKGITFCCIKSLFLRCLTYSAI